MKTLLRLVALCALSLGLLLVGVTPSHARDLATKTHRGCTITAVKPWLGSDMRAYTRVVIRCTSTQTVRGGAGNSWYRMLNEVPGGGDTGEGNVYAMSTYTLQANTTYQWTASQSYNSYHPYPWYTQAYVGMQSWGGERVRVESASCGC